MARLDADLRRAVATDRAQAGGADLTRALDEVSRRCAPTRCACSGCRRISIAWCRKAGVRDAARAAAGQRRDLARRRGERAAPGRRVAGWRRRGADEAKPRGRVARADAALSDEVDVAVGELTTLKVSATQARNAARTRGRRSSGCAPIGRRGGPRGPHRATLAETRPRATLRGDACACATRRAVQAEAEARARPTANGRRAGGAAGRLAERDAQLRTTRAEVARLAQAILAVEDALPGGGATPEPRWKSTSATVIATSSWGRSSTNTTCARCSAPRRNGARTSCAG
jgi:hypothetical protein